MEDFRKTFTSRSTPHQEPLRIRYCGRNYPLKTYQALRRRNSGNVLAEKPQGVASGLLFRGEALNESTKDYARVLKSLIASQTMNHHKSIHNHAAQHLFSYLEPAVLGRHVSHLANTLHAHILLRHIRRLHDRLAQTLAIPIQSLRITPWIE